MSGDIQMWIRSERASSQLAAAYREALSTFAPDESRYWVDFRVSSSEQRSDCESDYGFVCTVVGFAQPPRNAGDGPLYAAALALTRAEPSCELLVTYVREPMLAYRSGTAFPRADERPFFEREVLPSFAGAVDWDGPLVAGA